MRRPTLSPGNAHTIRYLLTQLVLATGAHGALSGRTDGLGWISATDGGEPIAGHEKVALAERAAGTADYVASLPGDVVTSITTGLADRMTLYEVVSFGTAVRVSNPIELRLVRRS